MHFDRISDDSNVNAEEPHMEKLCSRSFLWKLGHL